MKMTFRILIAILIVMAIFNTSCQPTDYSADINALKASRDSLAAALKITNANLLATNAAIAGLNTSVTAIQAQLTVISGQITTLNTQLTTTNATVAGNTATIAAIQSQIKAIQDQITTLNSQLTATNTTVSGLSTTVASIQTQLTSILSQVATLNSQQTATSASLADISAKLTSSMNQLNTLSTQFNTLLAQLILSGQIVKDADGNTYSTVSIGGQIWMTENLKTTKYNDGTAIPLVTDNTAWVNMVSPGYCWYNNDATTNKNTYGTLYNFYTVKTGNLCPIGWHVPTDADWTVLTTYLGGESVAGGKLKEIGNSHWLNPNTSATNEIGFTILPSGCRTSIGAFINVGTAGYWWTSTESSTANAWNRSLYYNSGTVFRGPNTEWLGFSVRCLKN